MKEHIKDDIAVTWDKEKCIHAALCVKGLPEVFKPGKSPWIQTEGATKEQLIAQIEKCPSGALAYKKK